MNKNRFPSGPWTGFYCYPNRHVKHPMNLQLTFEHGKISGSGDDNIGAFTISGSYNDVGLECQWIKQYIGQHQVWYEGGADHHGIWGTWSLFCGSGGFHIWPLQSGVGDEEAMEEEETLPVEAPGKVRVLTNA
jgi:hypothetical protein